MNKKILIFAAAVLVIWLVVKFLKPKPSENKEEINDKETVGGGGGGGTSGNGGNLLNNSIIPDGVVDFVNDKLNGFIGNKLDRTRPSGINQIVRKRPLIKTVAGKL